MYVIPRIEHQSSQLDNGLGHMTNYERNLCQLMSIRILYFLRICHRHLGHGYPLEQQQLYPFEKKNTF